MIKVSKKVDEQFKQVVQIAIERNALEPFKWLQKANSVKGEWGEGLEELDNISTEQMMLMYTMGYEVIEEVLHEREQLYALVDSNNKLVGYDESCDLIYTTLDIRDVRSDIYYHESKGLLDYINDEYENGVLARSPELAFPLRVVEISLEYKVTELDTSLD